MIQIAPLTDRLTPACQPARPTGNADSRWQIELASGFSRVDELLTFLLLPPDLGEECRRFPLKVPRVYAERMRKGDPNDPLLLQVLPVAAEGIDQAGFIADPVGDMDAAVAPGLLHKYHGRALVITTGACAIHCRYCFRREFPYAAAQWTRERDEAAMEYIRSDASLTEIILSGGDPLALNDQRLGELIAGIARIDHVRRLRIHTRLPIVLPSRVTDGFLKLLDPLEQQTVIVLHANHAQELDEAVAVACRNLHEAGATLLNQTVLLRGVNDTAEALADLSEGLFAIGVMPYYLHLLDPARGTAHFRVDDEAALALHDGLRRRLPGYLVPRLVREIAGEPYKSWLL